MTQSSVRFLGSRELHRELPRILDELEDQESRLVLTIHAKPKAVILGADAFATLVRQVGEVDRKLGEELSALLEVRVDKRRPVGKTTRVRNGQSQTRTTRKLAKATRGVRVKSE
jgi:PHD/YefM family antitoxin component YafN of YafNO toxin-antitoxin module